MAKTLRDKIIHQLKKGKPLTARDLIDKFEATPSNISRYLKELETESIAEKAGKSEEQRQAQLWTYKPSPAEASAARRVQEAATKRGLVDVPLDTPKRKGRKPRFNGQVTNALQRLESIETQIENLEGKKMEILEDLAEAVRAEL